jgi:hypothetical protein
VIGAGTRRTLAAVAFAAAGLAGCASGDQTADAAFPPPQPPAAAQHFKVTQPGQFPIDVYFSAWGEGYVIYAPGLAPIYLISDKKGGFVVQRPGESASFVSRRKDGSGWNVLRADGPATMFLRNTDGEGWILQAPGELPTLIVPWSQ